MRYKLENPANLTAETFNQVFANIPEQATLLDFCDSDLRLKTTTELKEIFKTIPAGITSVNFALNYLGENPGMEIVKIVPALPANIKTLLINNCKNDLQLFQRLSIDFHNSIRYFMQQTGYMFDSSGLCHGISFRWIEACLLNDESIFDERFANLQSHGNELALSINAIKEKNQHLKTGDKAILFPAHLLDILAFCDSVHLYNSSDHYSSLFNRSLHNTSDIEAVSSYASSDKTTSQGGLAKIFSALGIYTKTELKQYLDNLYAVTKGTNAFSNGMLGIILSSKNHTIAATLMPGEDWKLMDINQYPPLSFKPDNTDLMADRIIEGFLMVDRNIENFTSLEAPYIAFNTTIFTLGNHSYLSEMKKQLMAFTNRHQLTPEKICRSTPENDLLIVAVQQNHVDFIAKLAAHKICLESNYGGLPVICQTARQAQADMFAELAKFGANLEATGESGATPLMIAAYNGHVPIIEILGVFNANMNARSNCGETAVYTAAHNGQAEVIIELDKWNANMDTPTHDGITPAIIATLQGHLHVIVTLIKCHANFDISYSNGVTPAFLAAQNGQTAIMVALINYGVNFNLPFTSTADSLHKFASLRGQEIADRMQQFIISKQATSTEQNICLTPCDIASIMGHTDIVQLLNEHKAALERAQKIPRNNFSPSSSSKAGLFAKSVIPITDALVEFDDQKARNYL